MRAYQIFARMPREHGLAFMRTLADEAPLAFAQGLAAAGAMLKARPVYLRRLDFERRADAVRRALARVAADDLAEEMLATYFLECRRALLVEWLDGVGLEHEEGTLTGDSPPAPVAKALRDAVARFRRDAKPEDRADRELLLRAFAAQDAIDWPELDTLLDAADPAEPGASSEASPRRS